MRPIQGATRGCIPRVFTARGNAEDGAKRHHPIGDALAHPCGRSGVRRSAALALIADASASPRRAALHLAALRSAIVKGILKHYTRLVVAGTRLKFLYKRSQGRRQEFQKFEIRSSKYETNEEIRENEENTGKNMQSPCVSASVRQCVGASV